MDKNTKNKIIKRLSNIDNDNFFEIGGHSILAIQIASRLSEIFMVDVRIMDIFNNPTIEGLIGYYCFEKNLDEHLNHVSNLVMEMQE